MNVILLFSIKSCFFLFFFCDTFWIVRVFVCEVWSPRAVCFLWPPSFPFILFFKPRLKLLSRLLFLVQTPKNANLSISKQVKIWNCELLCSCECKHKRINSTKMKRVLNETVSSGMLGGTGNEKGILGQAEGQICKAKSLKFWFSLVGC